ncbi:MAG: hypothetical protein JRE47_02835 [Deltaproteobacteria bacterium]|nr:hypothetical protein [Deltaproteobacteria bacterium]
MEKRVAIHIDDKKFAAYPIEDIAWQAMTRGGRPVDKIIKGQVQFRKTHEKIGTTLTDISSNMLLASPVTSHSDTLSGVSAALGILGVAEMALAARTRTHADTRYWDNLPDSVHLVCLKIASGSHQLRTTYLNDSLVKISEDIETIKIPALDANSTILLWKRPNINYISGD